MLKITIGRDPSNDIVISDMSASRYHAEVLFSDFHSPVLNDLDSRNGTYYQTSRGWRRIESIKISPDHILKFGDAKMRAVAIIAKATKGLKNMPATKHKGPVSTQTDASREARHFQNPVRNPITGNIEEGK